MKMFQNHFAFNTVLKRVEGAHICQPKGISHNVCALFLDDSCKIFKRETHVFLNSLTAELLLSVDSFSTTVTLQPAEKGNLMLKCNTFQ